MKQITVMSIFGTRPEAIKMAPVIHELECYPETIRSIVVSTAQHREMVDSIIDTFHLTPAYDLNVMTANQDFATVIYSVMSRLAAILQHEQVDFMLVQGDTTTTFAASLTGFYHKIPVGHVEAGLRTHHMYYPFPEELNRALTSRLASVHFAPTPLAKANLLREGIPEQAIIVTGNTGIDALLHIVTRQGAGAPEPGAGKRTILVTSHRRENWGKPLEDICLALLDIVDRFMDVEIVFPVHLNPNVQKTVRAILEGRQRIRLLDPLDYPRFCQWLAKSYLILTDSGGIQEEAPSLGKPVLVLRNETERPEGIIAGTSRLVGTDRDAIVRETGMLLEKPDEYRKMAHIANPFGDGKAGKRIVQHILQRGLAN